MPAFHSRVRALAVGASAIALVAVGVGGTVAASNPATLYACYDVYGNVRMSDSAVCKLPGGGRLASWGTAAVPGPTGLTGATGPTGATGAQGPTGTAGASRVFTFAFGTPLATVFDGSEFSVGLDCVPSATAPFLGFSLANLSSVPVMYSVAEPGKNPIVATEGASGTTSASWNAALSPGVANLWVFGATENFHVIFAISPDSATSCRVVATY